MWLETQLQMNNKGAPYVWDVDATNGSLISGLSINLMYFSISCYFSTTFQRGNSYLIVKVASFYRLKIHIKHWINKESIKAIDSTPQQFVK